MKAILSFFASRHILTNFILLAVLAGGFLSWNRFNKEEMPDFTFNRVSVSVNYPGANAEEVEYFVVLPIEDALQGMDGVEEITSSASAGSGRINVWIDQNVTNMSEIVADIRSTVMEVDLPDEITDIPNVRQFKSSTKAIIDIALYDTSNHLMDAKIRKKVQAYALSLENRLLNLPQIVDVNRRSYLKEEIRIEADPLQLNYHRIPLNSLASKVKSYNQRRPAGTMKDDDESKVTVSAELKLEREFTPLVIQGGFEGKLVRLGQVATISRDFEESRGYLMVNGHEAVMLNAVKNSSTGIIKSVNAVQKVVEEFQKSALEGSSIKVVLLDDESRGVRNRLELISWNGSIGLFLILAMLFLFLNPQSGFWVSLGIPFCFGATMLMAYASGFTINNMTLAAVIIVMGMIVDDAIVVAENITRLKQNGTPIKLAVVEGTQFVSMPIVAAVLTTCIAFIPLLFIEDRFGALIRVIPPIIMFMLAASLFESLFILPGHMAFKFPYKFLKIITLGFLPNKVNRKQQKHWFDYVEDIYGLVLRGLLKIKILIFIFCGILVFMAINLFKNEMKFVLFPNEETTQIRCNIESPDSCRSYQTAEMSKVIDSILKPYIGKEVIGYRNQVAQSRWGRSARENRANMRIEIVPKEKREKSAKELMKEWDSALKSGEHGFKKVRFSTTRFGHSSGSSIEILVAENNNKLRNEVADSLMTALSSHPMLHSVEIDRPMMTPEYTIKLKRDKIFRLGINPFDIGQTIRTILEGAELYKFPTDNDEVRVVLSANAGSKKSISKLLRIPVENRNNYLVPLSEVVTVKKGFSQANIERENFKRVVRVVADIKPGVEITPLEIAADLDTTVFPKLVSKFKSSGFMYAGEVKDSRESKGTFTLAIYIVLGLIFSLLALLFNSLLKPFIIMITIPFALVGVIFAFHWHGMNQYGLFAMVGVLGLMGVVINDSIVMLVKLTCETKKGVCGSINKHVADIAKTRLRAVLLTTLTTVAGLFPTAYGIAGFDAMLVEMMLAMGWGLIFGTVITLLLVPAVYGAALQVRGLFIK